MRLVLKLHFSEHSTKVKYTYSIYFITIAGIIESDDIKAITDEIDRAVNYSNQASSLVETVKGKYKRKPGNDDRKVCSTTCIYH